MPRYQIAFDDGSSVEKDAASGDLAKQAAKAEARTRTGATSRTDPRVKVKYVVDLDAGRGPTDPRNQAQTGAAASSGDRSDRGVSDRELARRTNRGDSNSDALREQRDREDRDLRERRDREDRDLREREERDREDADRRDREGRS
jgi:hypothetical protein